MFGDHLNFVTKNPNKLSLQEIRGTIPEKYVF